MNLKEVECLVQLAQVKGSVAGCCEQGYWFLGSIKSRNLLTTWTPFTFWKTLQHELISEVNRTVVIIIIQTSTGQLHFNRFLCVLFWSYRITITIPYSDTQTFFVKKSRLNNESPKEFSVSQQSYTQHVFSDRCLKTNFRL